MCLILVPSPLSGLDEKEKLDFLKRENILTDLIGKSLEDLSDFRDFCTFIQEYYLEKIKDCSPYLKKRVSVEKLIKEDLIAHSYEIFGNVHVVPKHINRWDIEEKSEAYLCCLSCLEAYINKKLAE